MGARGRDTVATVLAGHAERTPDAPFLVTEAGTTSYRGMDARATRTAGALARLGVRQGDRFGVHLTNHAEFFDLWFAAARLGATVVPTNPLASVDELAYLVDHAECRVVVTQPDLRETVNSAAKAGSVTVVDIGEDWVRAEDVEYFSGLGPIDVDPTDTLGVLYTSGTTSRPKGVEVSHAAYLLCGDLVAGHLRLRPDDRGLIVLPIFHGNGQYYVTMSALVTGASVALAPSFSASGWSTRATTLGATFASLFAAPIRMILAAEAHPNDTAHALRVVVFAQSVTDAAITEFERRFEVPTVQLYGMTETVTPATLNPLYEDRRGRSMGRPLPGVRVRVVDADGVDVAQGDAGEVVVAGIPGETIMTRYLHNPEATAETLRGERSDGNGYRGERSDGNGYRGERSDEVWLHTGDSATVDADGYLWFVDRRKDMIKRSGENVASAEVESVVDQHPAVYESAVIGVPDEIRDEAIHAYVVRHATGEGDALTAEDLLAFCRERLSKFRVPDQVIFVDHLPRTSMGKIQKHLLRQEDAGPGEGPEP